MKIDPAAVTLAVLAGGQSRRMGTPKSHLQLAGRPILQFLLEQFDWPGPTLLVTAPGVEHPPAADRFDAEAADPLADQGPLRGVLTALQHASTPIVAVATVDMPGIGREQLERLIHCLAGHPDRLGVMVVRSLRSDAGGGRIEPFPFACRREAHSILHQRLAAGPRSMHSLTQLPQFATVAITWPQRVWANLNFPVDYDEFRRKPGLK